MTGADDAAADVTVRWKVSGCRVQPVAMEEEKRGREVNQAADRQVREEDKRRQNVTDTERSKRESHPSARVHERMSEREREISRVHECLLVYLCNAVSVRLFPCRVSRRQRQSRM